MCANMHPYMKRTETAEQVRRWFQTEVGKLWPVAIGSLSLRNSPCVREHCQLCESGQGHSSYALYGRKGDRRFAVYVPEDLAPAKSPVSGGLSAIWLCEFLGYSESGGYWRDRNRTGNKPAELAGKDSWGCGARRNLYADRERRHLRRPQCSPDRRAR